MKVLVQLGERALNDDFLRGWFNLAAKEIEEAHGSTKEWIAAFGNHRVAVVLLEGPRAHHPLVQGLAADRAGLPAIVADLPAAKRPTVYVRRTDGPEFISKLAEIKVSDPFEACYLPPVEVVVERPNP